MGRCIFGLAGVAGESSAAKESTRSTAQEFKEGRRFPQELLRLSCDYETVYSRLYAMLKFRKVLVPES